MTSRTTSIGLADFRAGGWRDAVLYSSDEERHVHRWYFVSLICLTDGLALPAGGLMYEERAHMWFRVSDILRKQLQQHF